MKLGEIIKDYRRKNALTQRDFAKKAGLSHGYISMIETNENPKTAAPVVPTIQKLNQISIAMEMTLHELIDVCDDMPVIVNAPDRDDGIELYKRLDDLDKAEIRGMMKQMLKAEKYGE